MRRLPEQPARTPLLCVALSFSAGLAGLALEILWTRQLTLETGGPLLSFAAVICGVTGGLAAGAAIFSSNAPVGQGAMRRLAALQGGVALFGLLSSLLSPAAPVRGLLLWLALDPSRPHFAWLQALLAGGAAFLPSLLMGGTFPLLIAAQRGDGDAGRQSGALTAANAFGASAGALLSGFLLLPSLGQRASLLAASAVAAASALVAAMASRRSIGPAISRAAHLQGELPSRTVEATLPAAILPAVLIVAGLATTALELVWARVATLTFGSSVQAASVVLSAVIAALALGGALGGRLAALRRWPAPRVAAGLLLASSGSALLVDPVVDRLPLASAALAPVLFPAAVSGTPWTAMGAQFLLVLLVAAPTCLPLGALLPVACGSAPKDADGSPRGPSLRARIAGRSSAALSAGTMLGAPAALLLLDTGIGSRGCLLGSAALLAATALLLPGLRLPGRAVAALLAVAALARGAMAGWDPAAMSAGPYLYAPLYAGASDNPDRPGLAAIRQALDSRGEIVDSIEGTTGLVTVRRLAHGALSMQFNGKTDASTAGDLRMQAMTAHLPLLLREASPASAAAPPPRLLIVGLGSGVTLSAALSHDVAFVEVVEISPEVGRAARRFSAVNRGALDDPRSRLTLADARARLLFSPGGREESWEIIASQPSNPWIAGQAVLFTREFFSLVRSRLSPGGLACQWLQGHGLDASDFQSVVATFQSVFPHTLLWEESTAGGDYLLIGALQPLALDPVLLSAAFAKPAVAADLAAIDLQQVARMLSLVASSGDSLAAFARGAPLQTEDRLALEFTAPGALRRETLPGILKALEPHRVDPGTLAPGDPALNLEIARLRREARRDREWAEALGLHRIRTAIDPELAQALSCLKGGRGALASAYLQGLIRRRPAARFPRLVLAHLLMAAGEAEPAREQLRVAVELDPQDPWGWVLLSRADYAAGRPAEALESSRRAESAGSLPASGWSDRCALLLLADDLPAAEAACLEALATEPDLPEARANLGVVQARRGRAGEAENSYRRALQLDPHLTDARINLASLLGRTGRPAEGLASIGPLLALGPGEAEVRRLAAWLALSAGDRELASRHAQRSLELDPGSQEGRDLIRRLGGGVKNGTGVDARSD